MTSVSRASGLADDFRCSKAKQSLAKIIFLTERDLTHPDQELAPDHDYVPSLSTPLRDDRTAPKFGLDPYETSPNSPFESPSTRDAMLHWEKVSKTLPSSTLNDYAGVVKSHSDGQRRHKNDHKVLNHLRQHPTPRSWRRRGPVCPELIPLRRAQTSKRDSTLPSLVQRQIALLETLLTSSPLKGVPKLNGKGCSHRGGSLQKPRRLASEHSKTSAPPSQNCSKLIA